MEVDIIIDAESAPAPGAENFDAFVGEKVVFSLKSIETPSRSFLAGRCAGRTSRSVLTESA